MIGKRVAGTLVALLILASMPSWAGSVRAAPADNLSPQEALYLGSAFTNIGIFGESLGRYTALIDAPLLFDDEWQRDATAELAIWRALNDSVQSLALPSPRFRPFYEELRLMFGTASEAASRLEDGVVSGDVAALDRGFRALERSRDHAEGVNAELEQIGGWDPPALPTETPHPTRTPEPSANPTPSVESTPTAPSKPRHGVYGRVVVDQPVKAAPDGVEGECAGYGFFAAMRPGETTVELFDHEGVRLAEVEVRPGIVTYVPEIRGAICSFGFRIARVPERESYLFRVGELGAISVDLDQMKDIDWSVRLTLVEP